MKSLQYIGLTLVILLSLALNGCGAKNIVINKQESEIMTDKNKAYVVFYYNEIPLFSKSRSIMEFDPTTYKPTFLGQLDNKQKLIQEISPGKHYYFTAYKEIFGRTVLIDAKAGEVFYVNARLGLVVDEKKSLKKSIKNELENSKCDLAYLNNLGFKKPYRKDNQEAFYNEFLSYEIVCKDNKILSFKDTSEISQDDIPNYQIVKSSKELVDTFYKMPEIKKERTQFDPSPTISSAKIYQKMISDYYQILVNYHKNAYQYATYLHPERYQIIKEINSENYNKYGSATLSVDNKIGNLPNNYVDDLNKSIIHQLSKINGNLKRNLTVKYEIINYTDGKIDGNVMAYILFGPLFSNEDLASLTERVSLIANIFFIENGNIISKVQYVDVAPLSFFGLNDNISEFISEYIKLNLIRQTE